MRGSKNPNPTPLEIARRNAGYSRKKLAELSGISYRTLECYEQGKNDINAAAVSTVKTLAQILNVPIEKIISE